MLSLNRSTALVLLCSSAIVAHADITTGLVAYYPFDGNANDASGHGNDGVLVGGVGPTSDRYGRNGAMHFDGVDGYISVADAPSLNPKNQVTVAYWIRVDGFGALWTPVVFKGDTSVGGNCFGGREYTFWLNSNSYISASSAGDGGCHHAADSKAFAMVSRWNHVVEVIDRKTAHRIYFYVNGKLLDQAADAYSSIYRSAAPLLIGWDFENVGAAHFHGVLDDLRIYNRALSKSDASELYRTSLRVAGTADGFKSVAITCLNVTTSDEVSFDSTNGKTSSWDCEAQGLFVRPGDDVRISIEGTAHQ
jgi:hypothetical protein